VAAEIAAKSSCASINAFSIPPTRVQSAVSQNFDERLTK